jgi:hypothetical protein
MVFCVIFLMGFLVQIGCTPVPDLGRCAIDYLSRDETINSTAESEIFEDDCDARIEVETQKFYDDIQNLIASGVNVDNLDNKNFVNHEKCIIETLRHFNVSSLYLKGIAYQKLNRVHQSEHSMNLKMTSQQILLLYSLQVCEPRSFYARHAEKIFTMNMRTTNAQAHCLLNHLNENSVGEPYQFTEEIESIGDLDVHKCNEIVREFTKKYYNVIDRARNFSIFGLHPEKAMKCRASNDKNLINHMILLTIFQRLTFTPDQIESEKLRFFEIAEGSAKSFFTCIEFYD